MLPGLLKNLSICLVFALASACGGGGSGGDSGSDTATPAPPPPVPAPPTPPEPPPPLDETVESASRLAARATFGLNFQALEALAERGSEAWLEAQFSLPVGLHEPVVRELLARQRAGDFAEIERNRNNIEVAFRRVAWWQQAVYAQDVLRQRVAFALSEILVVSEKVDVLARFPYALSNYYDTLLEHAFGNYRELLRAVTLHPTMGVYLSHINNSKARPAANIYPDENYAREVMQLFSIGLFELNPDGSEITDSEGRPIATYGNEDIREFARIFTGLSFGGKNTAFGSRLPDFRVPMQMFEAFHDQGQKTLLNGAVVPRGQGGLQDIDAAMDNLFNHPNVGPFIGRQLIQRLVTSNPSPAYIARVSAAFNGEDTGIRGDMRAVLRAILLDPEAQAPVGTYKDLGKLREPLLRTLALLRQFNVSSPDGFYANTGYGLEDLLQQHPLSSPSVFNFFLPAHAPVGSIANAGLVAPEFQITNSSTVVAVSNVADSILLGGQVNDLTLAPFQAAELDLGEYIALADDLEALVDRLDTVMTYGTLSAGTRASILDTIALIDNPLLRVKAAIYLVFTSPDYAVQL